MPSYSFSVMCFAMVKTAIICKMHSHHYWLWQSYYIMNTVYCKNLNIHTHTDQQQYWKSKWTTDNYQHHITRSLSSCCGLLLSNTYLSTWKNIAFLISQKVWPYSQTHSPSPNQTDTHTQFMGICFLPQKEVESQQCVCVTKKRFMYPVHE